MKKILLFICISCLVLGGCTKNISPNTYDASEVGTANKVLSGKIIAKRPINIDVNSGIGGIAGATAAGAAGSTIGNNGATHTIGAVGGAVAGGLVGNAIEKEIRKTKGYEYIIKLDNGSTISVAQVKDLPLSVNQQVLVIYGPTTRVVPDNRVTESP